MTKGYWTDIRAKLLLIVGETFLFDFTQTAPIVRTNFVRLISRASAAQSEPENIAIQARSLALRKCWTASSQKSGIKEVPNSSEPEVWH